MAGAGKQSGIVDQRLPASTVPGSIQIHCHGDESAARDCPTTGHIRPYRRHPQFGKDYCPQLPGESRTSTEELFAEHGIEVDHVTLFQWSQRFTTILMEAAKPYRHRLGSHWFVDESYVRGVSLRSCPGGGMRWAIKHQCFFKATRSSMRSVTMSRSSLTERRCAGTVPMPG